MTTQEWSEQTKQLREQASEILDKLARSMHKDRVAWGVDEEDEDLPLDGQQLTAWIAVTQFQGFENPEYSGIIYLHNGASAATVKGLAGFAVEYW